MKAWLIPTAILAAICAAAFFNCRVMESDADRWQSQLEETESAALAEDWALARSTLSHSYADWTAHQAYLHTVAHRDEVDNAETMYRRCAAYSLETDLSEFRAEMAGLKQQLRLLADMERFDLKNIL